MTDRMTKEQRTRNCLSCSSPFVARRYQIERGKGLYCSHKCAHAGGAYAALTEPEVMKRSADNRRASIAVNGTRHGRGEKNASWKGGHQAYLERNREKVRLYVRAYRAKNPDKTREFARKRRTQMLKKLPAGTIQKIGEAQRWRCAVCTANIKKKFHSDHINPLAKGGQNVPDNIQLLCPTCNLQKCAKHSIDFMQERGFLL